MLIELYNIGRFHKMKYSGDYYVTVIEDTRINKLIGSATLVIEHKFIHDCGNVLLQIYIRQNFNCQILIYFFYFRELV